MKQHNWAPEFLYIKINKEKLPGKCANMLQQVSSPMQQ